MNHSSIIKQLQANAGTFKALFEGASEELRTWKPAPDKWCLLEIVCHLYDEEREDFGARVKSTLQNPSEPWPKIDPLA